jgi:hypothetical protein
MNAGSFELSEAPLEGISLNAKSTTWQRHFNLFL